MATKGLRAQRIDHNPMERRFAEAWDREHEPGRSVLGYLLGDPNRLHYAGPPDVEERDAEVAATVIQWLGSPVGQHFLANALGVEGILGLLARVDGERSPVEGIRAMRREARDHHPSVVETLGKVLRMLGDADL